MVQPEPWFSYFLLLNKSLSYSEAGWAEMEGVPRDWRKQGCWSCWQPHKRGGRICRNKVIQELSSGKREKVNSWEQNWKAPEEFERQNKKEKEGCKNTSEVPIRSYPSLHLLSVLYYLPPLSHSRFCCSEVPAFSTKVPGHTSTTRSWGFSRHSSSPLKNISFKKRSFSHVPQFSLRFCSPLPQHPQTC